MKCFKIIIVLLISLLINYSLSAIEIKTAAQESHPKYILENGNMTGICMDIMKAIMKEDPEIIFTGTESFTPFRRIAVSLENGTLDVFFGMIKNEERLKQYTFVDIPLYPTRNMLMVRADDNIEINSFDDIRKLGNDGVLLVAAGTAHSKYLESQGGLIIDEGANTVEINIRKLLANRGRFVYSSDKNFMDELSKPEFKGKVRVLPVVLEKDYQFVAFSKNFDKEIVQRIEKILLKLKDNGELDKIFKKYIIID